MARGLFQAGRSRQGLLLPGSARGSSGRMPKKKSVRWTAPLVVSEVDAHPDLLSIPTFVLFVQKDELQMSRAEVRKEDRLEAQKEFERWLSDQTAPRATPPKKQLQNEESLAPVDDKERSAVAVRTQPQGPRGWPPLLGWLPAARGCAADGPQGAIQPRRGTRSAGRGESPPSPTAHPRGSAPRPTASTLPTTPRPRPRPRGRAGRRAQPDAQDADATPRRPAAETPTPRPGSSSSAQRGRPPSARRRTAAAR